MQETFVSEPIRPEAGSFDSGAMARGAPGVPAAFSWRGTRYAVSKLLSSWSQTGPCRHGSKERYVRRHWFEVLAGDGRVLKIYIDRTVKPGDKGRRWWLYSIRSGGS